VWLGAAPWAAAAGCVGRDVQLREAAPGLPSGSASATAVTSAGADRGGDSGPRVAEGTFHALASLEGRDLRQLSPPESAALASAIATIDEAGPSPRETTTPWRTQRLPLAGREVCILVEGQRLLAVPGESAAKITVVAADGTIIARSRFSTGWRLDISDASIAPETTHGFPVIDVKSTPTINGREIYHQLYGIAAGRIVLLRLADEGGHAVRNAFAYANWTFGPRSPSRTVEDWEAELASTDPVLVLEALNWIGGVHLDEVEWEKEASLSTREGRPLPSSREDAADTAVIPLLRASAAVQVRIEKLLASTDPWVQDAAWLAKTP